LGRVIVGSAPRDVEDDARPAGSTRRIAMDKKAKVPKKPKTAAGTKGGATAAPKR
jgi:hypothetical protein